MDDVQAVVQRRIAQHSLVQLRLRKYPRNTKLSNLSAVLQVQGELGKGVYGVVYDVRLLGQTPNESIPVAAKSVSTSDRPEKRETVFKRLLREEVALAYLNAMVTLHVCPGFPLVHKSFLTVHPKNDTYYSFLLCLERGDGNMRQWFLREPALTDHTIMQAMFQVFVAMVAYGEHLQLVHNDLYLKNILYNKITPTNLRFRLCNRTFFLPQVTTLFKISDFGICSSRPYLHNDHAEMGKLAEQPRIAASLDRLDFSKHILEYQNVPAYARDAAVLLKSLQSSAYRVPPVSRTWLRNAMRLLDHAAFQEHGMRTPADLTKFVLSIFAQPFLKEAGLPGDLFSDDGRSVGTAGPSAPTEEFCLDCTEETKRSMIFIFRDYTNSCSTTSAGPSTPVPLSAITPPTFF